MSEGKPERERRLGELAWKMKTDQAQPILNNESVVKIHDASQSQEKFSRENSGTPIKDLLAKNASQSSGLNKNVSKGMEALVPGKNGEKRDGGMELEENTLVVMEDSFDNATLTASEISTNRRVLFAEFCRICHGSDQDEKFLSPCNCKGSLTLVHKTCLERWLAQSDTAHCELCGVTFRMKREPKYGIFTSFMVWLTSNSTWRDRRKVILDIISFLCFFPILGVVNFLIFKLTDKMFGPPQYTITTSDGQINISEEEGRPSLMAVGEVGLCSLLLTCDIAFFAWLLLRIHYHISRWYSWFRRSCVVTLLDYPEVNIVRKKFQQSEPTTSSSNIQTIVF